MIIDCIADLHGHYPKLEGGDLLIVAGDLTAKHSKAEFARFTNWYLSQPYKKRVLVAGNHDTKIENGEYYFNHDWLGYLCDSGTEFTYQIEGFPEEDEGFLPTGKRTLKIWGSPWTRTFDGMNPHCKAFTVDTEEELADKFSSIPSDVDILITHSPPFTILDKTVDGRQVGSCALMAKHLSGMKPRLWVWGHIHEAYGTGGTFEWNNTRYVNASHVNEKYQPVNDPVRVIL